MNKTLIYLAILIVLGFGVYYFLFSSKDSPYSISEAGFTIKDTGDIGKIFLVNNDNNSILLEHTDNGWIVNKKYKALPSTLNTLLTTLMQQQAVYPVPKTMRNNVIKYMAGLSTKAEIYNKDGKKIRTFYVGNEAMNHEGTYMLMEGASSPYVVQIAGFQGYLTPRYTCNIKDWRDRTVFNLAPDQIKSVTIQYPDHAINSFTLRNDNGKVTVDADSGITHNNKFNQRRADVYVKFFQNVNCEGYLNGVEGMDTLLRMVPKKCSIDVTDKQGHQQHVDVYWMPVNRRSKNLLASDPNTPDNYDADRFYAVLNNGKDTAMIQRFVFDKIFRNAYEFYEPDEQPQKMQEPQAKQPLAPIRKMTVPYIKKNV